MKKVLSLAIAAALVAPVAAMADATVYGKVRLSGDYIDRDNAADNYSDFEINSHASRLGIKGSEDLGNGLKAIYKLEFGVSIAGSQGEFGDRTQVDCEEDVDGNLVCDATDNDVFTARNAYVGLAGNWGTALIGRHDTPMKMSTGKLDYFADTQADYNGRWNAGFADRRADGTIAYITPNWGGFTGALALVPGENSQADGLADGYSLAGMYSNGGLYLAAAYEAADENMDGLNVNDEPGDLSQWRVGGEYAFSSFKIAALYENEKIENQHFSGDFANADKWLISGSWALGKNDLKASYFQRKDDELAGDPENTGWNLGWDYNFSKRSQFYALYTAGKIEIDHQDDDKRDVISLGMNHAF